MAVPLSSLIGTIISRTKTLEICDTLHDAQIATTESELISAGLSLAVYTYQTGIVDDALLGDFDEALLNSFGIYTVGSYTLTDPPEEIYILKTANVTVNMTGNNKVKINVLGTGDLTLIAGDKSYIFVKGYGDATISVSVSDNAMVYLDIKENNIVAAATYNNGILHCNQLGDSTATLTANNTSYCLFKLWGNSELTYTTNDTAIVETVIYQSATIAST